MLDDLGILDRSYIWMFWSDTTGPGTVLSRKIP